MQNIDDLIYGSSKLEHIVAIEYNKNNELELFFEHPSGEIESIIKNDVPYYLVSDRPISADFETLNGNLPLKYLKKCKTKEEWWSYRRLGRGANFLNIYDEREAAMILCGFTNFKGLTPKQVSVLSFDIEATGVERGPDSKVLLISNTFQKNGVITRKLFAYDEYESEGKMLEAWCDWVRDINPSIICGHNIYDYDFPYIHFCARKSGVELRLGRDDSPLWFNEYESKFRRDQSQFYTYRAANIYGRSIVDTFFLSIKYDVARKYESYGLKQIIKQEGLEVEGRQHYDASLIRHNYSNSTEWQKIKAYAEHDADDSLNLYNLMSPAFFYLARSVPSPYQTLMTTASGRQINSILIRNYLAANHSLPVPTETVEYEGATSIGNPGVYKNVFKVDVASLYPSIMLQYGVVNREKDPLDYFLQILSHLTKERLNNKKLAKETGDRSYKDLEGGQKIIINSVYGMQGAPGLNFNMPECASDVTRRGREILSAAIRWAEKNEQTLVNADTDSISICGADWTNSSIRKTTLEHLNSFFPERIRWEDDGTYDRVLVLKIKNYVLDLPNGKRTVKGSALKATLKEPALREFIAQIIDSLINERSWEVPILYRKYVNEIVNLKDIKRWSFKKTITESILMPSRTNEQKVLDALVGLEFAQGDKRYFYFKTDDSLGIVDKWNGDHNVDKLLEKLYKTLLIFEPVYDVKQCLNYKLKKNKRLLAKTNTIYRFDNN